MSKGTVLTVAMVAAGVSWTLLYVMNASADATRSDGRVFVPNPNTQAAASLVGIAAAGTAAVLLFQGVTPKGF